MSADGEADGRASQYPCGEHGPTTCVLLSYELRNDIVDYQNDIWFLQTDGRQLSYQGSYKADVFRDAQRGGTIRAVDLAHIVANSSVAGPTLSREVVLHLASLLKQSRSRELEQKNSRCKDGSTVTIRGYWSEPEGSASQFFTLIEVRCGIVAAENPSPAASELVRFVYDIAGAVKDFAPPLVPPWERHH
jgi:hypothetical protein